MRKDNAKRNWGVMLKGETRTKQQIQIYWRKTENTEREKNRKIKKHIDKEKIKTKGNDREERKT